MKLRIGHKTYTVSRMTSREREAAAEELGATFLTGYCAARQGVIKVWPNVSPCEQADVLLHETLHAIWDAVELPDAPPEEDAVTRLAHGLCQVIRDNPGFCEVLMAGLSGTPIFKGSR